MASHSNDPMARPSGFQDHSCEGVALTENEDMDSTDEDLIWVGSQASSPWMMATPNGDLLQCPKDEPMNIDLTGDDDVAEGSMEQITSKPNDPTAKKPPHQISHREEHLTSAGRTFFHSSRAHINMDYSQQPLHSLTADMMSPNTDCINTEPTIYEATMNMTHDSDLNHFIFQQALRGIRPTDISHAPTERIGAELGANEPKGGVSSVAEDSTVSEVEIYDLTNDMAHISASSTINPIDLTEEQPPSIEEPGPRRRGRHRIPRTRWNRASLKPGTCVEFIDGSFMKILQIITQDDHLRLSGQRLFRTNYIKCETFLPKLDNELVWVTQMDDLMSSNDVQRKLQIRFTNFRANMMVEPSMLTCRLKLTIRQAGVILKDDHAPTTSDQFAIEYLEHHETDRGFGKWSNELRAEWRGETVPFGAALQSSRALEIERETGSINVDTERAYTFGDAFCGAGGVSCGAKQAGVRIKYANDMDQRALDTYVLNHNDMEAECSDFNHFITNSEDFLRVDLAHASPPCQTWSPAHTVNSANDDANSACVFSGVDLARVSKCRILTMEETAGLPSRHPLVFNRLLLSLIEIGYSVRWSILGCDKYGVPQDRKRLIVLAAGPGEVLPNYAEPTHGIVGHDGEFIERPTIASTIDIIPNDAENHDPAKGLERWRYVHREAFDGNTLAKTITCGGGEFNYHPSGCRPYTDREVAALQTFPLDYHFVGVYTRKQIGNAVPPLFAKKIYEEVIRSLRETDKAEAEGTFR